MLELAGYYDPYPALYLDRPKVLVGPLGGGIALTGASASAMLDYPYRPRSTCRAQLWL